MTTPDMAQVQMILVAQRRLNTLLMQLSEGQTIEGFEHHIVATTDLDSPQGGEIRIAWEDVHR